MSNSVQPHRWQPTRLPHPWDSPGKNTGVGCHFLLQCMKVKLLSRVRLLATPWTAAYQAPPSMGFSRQEYWSRLPLPSLSNNATPWYSLKLAENLGSYKSCIKVFITTLFIMLELGNKQDRSVDKQTVIHAHNWILYSNKKWTIKPWKYMEEP